MSYAFGVEIGERQARRVLNRLNDKTPALHMLEPFEQLSTQCYQAIEEYLHLQVNERVPAEMVSRRELSRALLATIVDMQQAEKKASKNSIKDFQIPEIFAQAGGFFVGGLLIFFSSHILGLFDQKIFSVQDPRLLMVPENVTNVARRLKLPVDRFIRWVMLHETVHAVQYAMAPHLREQMRIQVQELMQLPRNKRPQKLKELVAMMSFIEGQAEHIMDAAATIPIDGGTLLQTSEVAQMRTAIDAARQDQHWLIKLLNPASGKMRQYQQGKLFCDQIVADAGPDALALPLRDQLFIPSSAEIEEPEIWLQRARPILGI